jgi:hypothetical protein
MGLVDQLQERRDVFQGLEPLRPWRRLAVGPGEEAPGAREDSVRNEAAWSGQDLTSPWRSSSI